MRSTMTLTPGPSGLGWKAAMSGALDTVKRYRSATIHGIRAQRKRLSRSSSYWNGSAWVKMAGTARYVGWNPGRSRRRAYAEKASAGEVERRLANWQRSKVGRAFLRRRREGRYPTVQSAEAIREAVEEKRRFTNLRRGYRRGILSLLDPTVCPDHDLGLDVPIEHCICPEP